jgi:hypothetical protein
MSLSASPCKARPTLLNRARQIWLHLRYAIEGSVVWTLTQALSKNIELSICYAPHTKSPKSDHLRNEGTNVTISHERLLRWSWKFLHTCTSVNSSHSKIFVPRHWTTRILLTSKHRKNSTFSRTLEIHNFWLERGRDLESSLQIEHLVMYSP